MHYDDLSTAQQSQVVNTFKHWLESTGYSMRLACKITNRIHGFDLNTEQYKDICKCIGLKIPDVK